MYVDTEMQGVSLVLPFLELSFFAIWRKWHNEVNRIEEGKVCVMFLHS